MSLRSGALLCAALVLSTGCVRSRVDTRIERGATLRAFEREGAPAPGGVRAEVGLQWPKAQLRFVRFDLCPVERVEEYEEHRITDRTSNGGVASLGMGVTTALVGAGLLLALPVFSNAPNTEVIDAEGRYGPSSRQFARGFGIGLLVLGVPTLGAAAWELSGSGEKVQTTRREQLSEGEPVRCNLRPAEGTAELLGTRGPILTTRRDDGALEVTAEEVKTASISGAAVNGEDAVIDVEDWERLVAFQSCASAGPVPEAKALIVLETAALRGRLDAARACEEVPGAPAKEWVDALEKELTARRAVEGGALAGPSVTSFEDALATWPPAITIPSPGTEIDALAGPEALRGLSVLLRGELVDFLESNIAVLQVEGRHVWLYLDAARPWTDAVRAGAPLEVLGVVMGAQEVGKLEAPLIRVLWARTPPPEGGAEKAP